MNYSAYLKMNASQLEDEISKQKSKIKNINETIALLKKLKIAAEVSEKSQNDKSEKMQSEQITKTENPKPQQTNIPKNTDEQPVKSQTNHQSIQSQHKQTSGGLLNGFNNKIHR